MSNYTKTTNFLAKDSLPENDSGKIIKGSEFDVEFNALQTAVNTKADLASPALTGVPTAPTASSGTNTTQLATTAFVTAANTATLAANNTWTGTQTFKDNKFEVVDDSDATKKLTLQLSGVTTATTRTLTVPDKNGTIAVTSDISLADPLNAASNTVVSGSYAVTSSTTITITATNTYTAGQTVYIQFTNSSGSSLTNGNFSVVSATGSSFTITYDSSVTSAGTCITSRYGIVALATSADLTSRTDTLRAITSSSLTISRATSQSMVGTDPVTFTNIPSWVKRITVITSNSNTSPAIRLGTASGIVATGYTSVAFSALSGNQTSSGSSSTEFITQANNGAFVIYNITGNTWVSAGTHANSGNRGSISSGYIALSGTLTQLQLIGTFTSGTINIFYE